MRAATTGARMSVAGALAGLVVAAGLVVGTGTAAATPTYCTTRKDNTSTGSVICNGGTGQVRVVVSCVDNFSGDKSVQYGDYKPVGYRSTRTCYPGQRSQVTNVSYQTKG